MMLEFFMLLKSKQNNIVKHVLNDEGWSFFMLKLAYAQEKLTNTFFNLVDRI